MRVVFEEAGGTVVGFLAASAEMVAALYVHVDYHGRGIGSALLDLAKLESSGRLRLLTFQKNERAQRFYEAHGFSVIKRGFEKDWQLEDLEYEWVRVDGRPELSRPQQ
ncbi:MAG: GNAT family N-acetyltransferase [Planctomycetota bacterium]